MTIEDQWICHRWRGHGDVLNKATDADRRNPLTNLPPLITSEWLNKPRELRAKTCATADDAVAWLETEVNAVSPQIKEPGAWSRFTTSIEDFRDRLTAFRPVTVSYWLVDNTRLDLNVTPSRWREPEAPPS
ncbi:hypothetical protein [Phytomonospora endophytica]|uniref:Uncharacterized protein n=1 Tax=Phytomonospora endophytica TaxID=714109 RepID=A0A841G3P3_9ACTN|nr:hypothetical protein [Phytomonospora endophytica]MBB6039329.1 hypothetical protein [Phytomonospora endophytica]GIG69729.1 hypothetical protein Pen01_60240 [Phytomonospora endophytica]